MALEDFNGKMVLLGGSVVFVEFLSGWKCWRERTRALVNFRIFSKNFGGFSECLERLGLNHNYFSETDGPAAISSNVKGPW
jgi:hypothetical protein